MRMLLGRIVRMKKATAWGAWSHFVYHMREEERITEARAAAVRRIIDKMLCAFESRALRKWRDAVHFMAVESALEAERAKLTALLATKNQVEALTRLKRLVNAVASSVLRKGWYTWKQKSWRARKPE